MHVDRALGIVDPERGLVGAVLLQGWNGTGVELSYYGQHTLTPGIVRGIARVVAGEFRAVRLTAVTSKRNRGVIKFMQRIGFRIEGSQRRYFGDRDCDKHTGVRLVMFRERIAEIARAGAETTNMRGPHALLSTSRV